MGIRYSAEQSTHSKSGDKREICIIRGWVYGSFRDPSDRVGRGNFQAIQEAGCINMYWL